MTRADLLFEKIPPKESSFIRDNITHYFRIQGRDYFDLDYDSLSLYSIYWLAAAGYKTELMHQSECHEPMIKAEYILRVFGGLHEK